MEENKRGANTLYLVIGVATLVVAIIGATFAYFTASAENDGDQITGQTSNVGNALSINVSKVSFQNTGAATDNLVPAVIDVTTDGIANAVNGKCAKDGYTGCHLYKITANTVQDLAAADILLHSFNIDTAKDKDSWKFVVFTGTEAKAGESEDTTYTVNSIIGNAAQSFTGAAAQKPSGENTSAGYNINNGKLTAGEHIYYLLVYLQNKEDIQNPTDTENANYAIGTYSGSISFNAAGGKVVANFSTTVAP